ncbi:MAG: hypothetical protein ABL881_09215, partial [Novosphingobium sp.]
MPCWPPTPADIVNHIPARLGIPNRVNAMSSRSKIGDPSGIEAVANAVREIQSFYRYDGPAVSLADMNRAVQKAVGKKFSRKTVR